MQHKYTVGDTYTSFIDKKIPGSLGYGWRGDAIKQQLFTEEIKFKLPVVTEKNNMDIFS